LLLVISLSGGDADPAATKSNMAETGFALGAILWLGALSAAVLSRWILRLFGWAWASLLVQAPALNSDVGAAVGALGRIALALLVIAIAIYVVGAFLGLLKIGWRAL
jgi:hypothetical protein